MAQVSGVLPVHGEAICIPLGPAGLQTQQRFLESGAGVGEAGGLPRGVLLLLPVRGRLGLCPAQRSPVLVPSGGGHGQGHSGRIAQVLGRSILRLRGPRQPPQVAGKVLAKVLPALVPLPQLPQCF